MVREFVGTLAAVAFAAVAAAETVTIAPANGVTTNVPPISGTTDVVVNPGASGGGIVELDPASDYIGTTSLGCGTLVASVVTNAGMASSLGKSGWIRLGPGTFRYTGGPATTSRSFTNAIVHVAGGGTKACVWDIRGDLKVTGRLDQRFGGFVKTGPGTLNLASGSSIYVAAESGGQHAKKGISDADYRKRLVFNANGDSPTSGFTGLTVAEGTLVLGEGQGIAYLNSDYDSIIGTWTAEPGGAEKSGTLEIRGGKVRSFAWTVIGQMNGNTGNSVPGRSCVRVTGGVVDFDHPVCFGRNKPGYTSYKQLTYPCWEQTGGVVTIKESGLAMCDDRGANSTATISGGVLNAPVICGRCSGSADTWGRLTICNSGRVNATDTYASNEILFEIAVTNGGRFGFTRLRGKTSGRLRLLVDGGTLTSRIGSNTASDWVESSVKSFCVGTRGAALEIDAVNSRRRIFKPISGSSTVAGLMPRGVCFRGYPACSGTFELRAACTYEGPTTVSRNATLALGDGGALPAGSALVLGRDGGFETLVSSVSVPALTVGDDDVPTRVVRLGVTPAAALVCTGAFACDVETDLDVALYTGGGSTDALAVAGSYPVLTVPAEYATALARLRPARSNPVDGLKTAFTVTTSGATATLTAVVEPGTEGVREAVDLVTSLGECRLVRGPYDLTGRALIVTDLQHLKGQHTVLRATGGVTGEFAETNLAGTGFEVWKMGNRVILSRTQPTNPTMLILR